MSLIRKLTFFLAATPISLFFIGEKYIIYPIFALIFQFSMFFLWFWLENRDGIYDYSIKNKHNE